ncbi:hypothetical protein Nepgr_032307 [Nepenthes gracilis]|uniref:PA domain-containing protein n=1 Tax=Nepenthes gracilis TaxID=150966 RepID=A0AAD3Y7S6_NEPGR|nr:hypothetical protein Nepgr_032307 [Nepenthes gracilis]
MPAGQYQESEREGTSFPIRSMHKIPEHTPWIKADKDHGLHCSALAFYTSALCIYHGQKLESCSIASRYLPNFSTHLSQRLKSRHRFNQEAFLEAVDLAQLVENGASNGSLARVPQTSSLDNEDVKGTDGGAQKHGTVFLDPEPQAIEVWPKKLQPFDGNGQELNPLDDRTRDLGPLESQPTEFLKELQGHHTVLRECIEQLTSFEASRATLVSYLREALHEQEFKLDQYRNQLQAAPLQSERAANICQQLLNSSNVHLLDDQGLQELSTTHPGGEQISLLYTKQLPSPEKFAAMEDDDPQKSAAAAVAAKLTASTSSAQMLTHVQSSLTQEGVISSVVEESPSDIPSEKRPKLENDQSYVPPSAQLPPLPLFPYPDATQQNAPTSNQQPTPDEQLPPPSSSLPLPLLPPMPQVIKALKLLVDEWWVGIVLNSGPPTSVLPASTPLGHLKMGKTAHYLDAATASSLMDKQGRKRLPITRFSERAVSMLLLSLSFTWKARGDHHRNVCSVPVLAPGTNPASAARCGMNIVTVGSETKGHISIDESRTAAVANKDNPPTLMVTYLPTQGVYEEAGVPMENILYLGGPNIAFQIYNNECTNVRIRGAGIVAALTNESSTSKSDYFSHCTSEMIFITHLVAEDPAKLARPLLADTYVTLLKGRNAGYGQMLAKGELNLDMLAKGELNLDMDDCISGKRQGMIQGIYEEDCGQICLEPFTSTPIGSPCGCVLPMRVRLLLSIAVYALFPEVNELEIEVAAGTYLKHSQLQIVGATTDSQNQERTIVDLNLVPLGENFDNTTATLIFERLLRKKGQSLAPKRLPPGVFFPLMKATDAKLASASLASALLCEDETLDPKKAKGKIIVCLRGINARVDKGMQCALAGAVGMVLANDQDNGNELIADAHFLPASHINYSDGVYVYSNINSTKSPKAYITYTDTKLGTKPAPFMAAFSSKGPNTVTPEILKPDVTAPEVIVIAAFTEAQGPTNEPFDTRRVKFNSLSGTSMSWNAGCGVGLIVLKQPLLHLTEAISGYNEHVIWDEFLLKSEEEERPKLMLMKGRSDDEAEVCMLDLILKEKC